jgi:hypothetical protein
MRPFKLFNALILFCVLTAFVSGAADSNKTISFQGYLTNTDGTPYQGTVKMSFKFCSDKNGTNLNFTNAATIERDVTIFNGNYTTKIALDAADVEKIAKQENLWIEVIVNGTGMTPRIEMISAPYAMLVKGIKYDAVNDTVMIGYNSEPVTAAYSGNSTSDKNGGGLVVKSFIGINKNKDGTGGLYIAAPSKIEGDVTVNSVTATQVFGAIWN